MSEQLIAHQFSLATRSCRLCNQRWSAIKSKYCMSFMDAVERIADRAKEDMKNYQMLVSGMQETLRKYHANRLAECQESAVVTDQSSKHTIEQLIDGQIWVGTYTVRYDEHGWPCGGTAIEWERVLCTK